jgi:hypothetical protein
LAIFIPPIIGHMSICNDDFMMESSANVKEFAEKNGEIAKVNSTSPMHRLLLRNEKEPKPSNRM